MPCRGLLAFLITGSLAFAQQTAEVETKDAPVKFTSRVNLVPVTVVVRDRDGHAIGTLAKEDFRLRDNGQPQVIARFSIEKPGAPIVMEQETPGREPRSRPRAAGRAAPPVIADHFVAYLFDDIHVKAEDLMRARDAAGRVMASSIQPAGRAAIFTTSGRVVQDFTNDPPALHETLARLRPASLTGGVGHGLECPDISYYMADRIVNLNDSQALRAALINYQACSHSPYVAAPEVMMFAQRALHDGEHETRVAASVVGQVVRRLAAMPGQRSLVLASPGFFVPFTGQTDITEVINRAIRAKVVISSLDVRGIWAPPEFDASLPSTAGGPLVSALLHRYMREEQDAQDLVLEDLAHSTGGQWFHANNSLDDGFRRLAAAPEFVYVLAFTPENLKSDGKYHKLQVTLREARGLTLQARKGYYAPRREVDASDQVKQDIEDAVFSREVLQDFPLAIRTQFFRGGEADAKLSVVSQLDIRGLPYRKEAGRNRDTLTVVSALFDINGNYVAGEQKIVELRLKDETIEKKLGSGIRIKSSFDVKTGNYVVRVVVKDSEGRMTASGNTAVEVQ